MTRQSHPEPTDRPARPEQRGPGEPPVGDRAVADLMSSELYSVGQDETVTIAWELLERSGVHHLPVVRADGACVGVLDRAELAIACAAPACSLSGGRVGALLRGRRSAVVHGSDPVLKAAGVMSRTGSDAVPVVAENGVLLGLLTARDIVAALAGQLPLRRPPAGGPPRTASSLVAGLPPRREERGTAVP